MKFSGQKTRVGSLSRLQGIFPTQGSNPGLPHCRWILYQPSHKGSPLPLSDCNHVYVHLHWKILSCSRTRTVFPLPLYPQFTVQCFTWYIFSKSILCKCIRDLDSLEMRMMAVCGVCAQPCTWRLSWATFMRCCKLKRNERRRQVS